MTQEILNPHESYALSPEALEFTNVYLSTLDLEDTAQQLGIDLEDAQKYLRKKEVKRFLDNVFLEQGYTSRFKLKDLLTTVIESKIEEAQETGVYTSKDLYDLIKLMMDMRAQEIKLLEQDKGPAKQTNVQVNNYNDNLSNLISGLVNNG